MGFKVGKNVGFSDRLVLEIAYSITQVFQRGKIGVPEPQKYTFGSPLLIRSSTEQIELDSGHSLV